MSEDRIAPEGKLWVCCACGKTSRDLYGDKGSGWDESCMLNAGLYDETDLWFSSVGPGRRVVEIRPDPAPSQPKSEGERG